MVETVDRPLETPGQPSPLGEFQVSERLSLSQKPRLMSPEASMQGDPSVLIWDLVGTLQQPGVKWPKCLKNASLESSQMTQMLRSGSLQELVV